MHSFSQTRTYFHLAKSTFSQQLHLTFHPNSPRTISSQTQVFSNSIVTQTAPEQRHPRHKSSPIPLSPKQPQNNLIPDTSLLRFHGQPNSPRTTSSQTRVFSDSTVNQTAPEQPHPRHKSSLISRSPKQPQNNLIQDTSLLRFHGYPNSPRTTSSKTRLLRFHCHPNSPRTTSSQAQSSPGWGRHTKQHTNFHRSRLVVDTVAGGDADALQGLVMLGVPPSPSVTKLHL